MSGQEQAGQPPTRKQAVWRASLSVVVLALVFGFALPHVADYGEAWAVVAAMTAWEAALLGLVSLWNLFSYWPVLMLAQPGLRLSEAAVVNQASTAVANTVPAGSAVAIGVTFQMLRTWGFSSESVANQTVLTGVWNQLVKLALPVVAVVAVVANGHDDPRLGRLAVLGVVVATATVGLGVAVLRSPWFVERTGAAVDNVAGAAVAIFGGPDRPPTAAAWLSRLRLQMIEVLRRRAFALSVATLVSHLSLYLVLLASIRAVGITSAQLSWSTVLIGFALVRLLSAIPLTPGGLGVVELGYVGFLAAGAEHGLGTRIAAAVLLFRAITYVLPVALGGIAWLVYLYSASWRRPPNSRGADGVLTPQVVR